MRLTLRRIEWTRYRVPFASGFVTAHGRMAVRQGLLLRLTTAEGVVGLGEAAPLAEFRGGTVGETEADLRRIAPALLRADIVHVPAMLDGLLDAGGETAALRCAFDVAALDIQAQSARLPVAAMLSPCHARAVRVNATVGSVETAAALTAARRAVAANFEAIKLKVGVVGSVEAEINRVAAVRAVIDPAVALRLDANGAWSLDDAIPFLHGVSHLAIELIEQPVSATDLAGLARVRRAVNLPIAADEAVASLDAARRIIAHEAADALIIKPMAVGGLRAARQIIQLAAAAGLNAIVTTTIDTGVGIAAALHLAATLPAGASACGLATADLLEDDLLCEPLSINAGWMQLPNRPGLGIDLDEQSLARFAVGPLWCAE